MGLSLFTFGSSASRKNKNKKMFCVFVALVFVGVCQATSNRPVIGILTQPTDGKLTAYGSSCKRDFFF